MKEAGNYYHSLPTHRTRTQGPSTIHRTSYSDLHDRAVSPSSGSPFGETRRADVWGSTYNKLFELFRDDERPEGTRRNTEEREERNVVGRSILLSSTRASEGGQREAATSGLSPLPSSQDDVFSSHKSSPVPGSKKKLVYKMPAEMVRVALPPGEYDFPPLEAPGGHLRRSSSSAASALVSRVWDSGRSKKELVSKQLNSSPSEVRMDSVGEGEKPTVKTTTWRCSNGRKAAIVQIDEIARIIRWIDPEEENRGEGGLHSLPSSSPLPPPSSPLPPPSSSVQPYERQLVDVVEEKVARRLPLDWPELFVLKNSHCRVVVPIEWKLNGLLKYNRDSHHAEVEALSRQMDEEYCRYQKLLDRIVLCGSAYTRLAHMIMRADAVWFHARGTGAIDFYAQLLEKAEECMEADDVALLTLLQKLTRILAESANFDPSLVVKASMLIERAERRLEQKSDGEAARRIRVIRYNLDSVNEVCRKHPL